MEKRILYKKLEFAKNLKLTNSEQSVKHIIKNSIPSVENLKQKLIKDEISYPNDYVFVSLANRVYQEKKNVEKNDNNLYGNKIDEEIGNWQLLTVAHNDDSLDGYVGAAYWNPDCQQIIIAHRGTHLGDARAISGTLCSDIIGICLNKHVSQINSAVTFTHTIINILETIKQETGDGGQKKPSIQLFFTGHSLGGWLSQITTFTAKCLKRDGDNFIKNVDFEITGFHACGVVFDSPGGRNVLERIQDKLMHRCGPSYVNRLDITSYLSAPNLVNTCNTHTGEVYTISLILSREDIKRMRQNFAGNIRMMHSSEKIKQVFDPSSGTVRKDEKGKLRIEKVLDWPLLSIGDSAKMIQANIVRAVKEVFPIISAIKNFGGYIYLLRFKKEWRQKFSNELEKVPTSGDEDNDCNLQDNDVVYSASDNFFFCDRHYTTELSEDYIHQRSINSFTRLERHFLNTCNLLYKNKKALPEEFRFDSMFPSLHGNEKFKEKTMEMLEDYKILEKNEKETIEAGKLRIFVPFIKHLLQLFPEIITDVQNALQRLPIHILSTVFNSASSQYLNSINNSLEFDNSLYESLNEMLNDFLNKNKNLMIMHMVHFNASIGTLLVSETLKLYEKNDQAKLFFNLERIFHMGDSLFIEFLKKVQNKFLVVIECNYAENEIVKDFLKRLFVTSKLPNNIKVILVTDKDSDLSEWIKTLQNNELIREEVKVSFNDLSSGTQNKVLEKTVIFQGKKVCLRNLINANFNMDSLIGHEIIVKLANNEMIEIGKPLSSLGGIEKYFIERKLVKRVKVNKNVLVNVTLTDLFAFSDVTKEWLSKKVKPGMMVRCFDERDPDKNNPIRFIILKEDSEEENFKFLCYNYAKCTIHWLKKSNEGDLIWKRSRGKNLSGLRRYIDNYESYLSIDELSEDNSGIKIVDVNDIKTFDEKIVIIAAEPGMGKTTALTRLGIQKDDYEWFIRINLGDYKYILEKMNLSEDDSFFKFLLKSNPFSSALEDKLLKHSLINNGNIVLLLDGFDEITIKDQKSVINLIHKTSETKIEKIIISTRLHLRNELENAFSTFAYTFQPFFEKEQKQFLNKFWKYDVNHRVDQCVLENYIDRLLKFVSESIGDKGRNFMGIPLQIRMVGEAFRDNVKNTNLSDSESIFPENFNIIKLYDRFVYNKFLVYFGKKGAKNIDLDEKEDWIVSAPTKVHKRIAFKFLFPEMKKYFIGNSLAPEEDKLSIEKQRVNQVGIAHYIGDRVVFIHRTFAEFFAAGFLADRLNKDKSCEKYKVTIEFLARELFESRNKVIKIFLDHLLATNELHDAILNGNFFYSLLSKENISTTDNLGRTALHYAAQEENKEMVNKLLKSGVDGKITDELEKTALHYAARYNKGPNIVSTLLKPFRLKIVSEFNQFHRNFTKNEKNQFQIEDDYLDDDDRNMFTVVKFASERGLCHIFNNFSEIFFKQVANVDDNYHIFNLSFFSSLDSHKPNFKDDSIFNYIRDRRANTLLHIAALNGRSAVVEFLLKKGAFIDVKNGSGKRPIDYAAKKEYWYIVECLLRKKSSLPYLDNNKLLKYSSDNHHWDIVKLFMTFNNRDYYFSKLDDAQRIEFVLYNMCTSEWNTNDLGVTDIEPIRRNILSHISKEQFQNPFLYAAENGYWGIVVCMLRMGSNFNNLSHEQKLSLLDHSDQHSNWDIVKSFLLSDNNMAYIDHLIDAQNLNYLYHLISVDDLDATKYFIERFVERGIGVNVPDNDGKTFLHVAAENGKLDQVMYLLSKNADLNAVTNSRKTALDLAVRNRHTSVGEYLDVQSKIRNSQ